MKAMPRLLMAVGMVLLAGACHRRPALPPQEQATVNALTSNLTTRCVGRYLIDVPAGAIANDTLDVEGVSIEGKAMSLEAHRKAMQARSDEMKATQTWRGYRFLYTDTAIEGIAESRLLVTLGDPRPLTDADRLIEAYRWDNGYQIKMKIEASNAKDSVYFKDKAYVRDDPNMTDVREKSQLVVQLLDRARGRADNEIPNEPGVCFDGGWLIGPSWKKENASAQFVLAHHDDVSIQMDTDSDIRTADALLERGGEIQDGLSQANGHTLRKGRVDLSGLHAEEWLMAGKTLLDVQGFLLDLEANSKIGSPQTPLISLTMRVGYPNSVLQTDHLNKVSLTEGEAIGLWDAVSRTLRPRPNAF